MKRVRSATKPAASASRRATTTTPAYSTKLAPARGDGSCPNLIQRLARTWLLTSTTGDSLPVRLGRIGPLRAIFRNLAP